MTETFPLPNKYFVGIDNGVTGSIGVIEYNGVTKKSSFIKTPVIKCLSYTKEVQHIQRVKWQELVENLPEAEMVLIERPMVNPRAFTATQSALRSLESTIIVMEMLGLKYEYIDSKTWQREFIASSVMGHDEMKEASKQIGLKLFPSNGNFIEKHGDADGLLIAEYCFRKYGK
jgi:hypothetical protein